MSGQPDVVIVGVGYVGLTLAATLADLGIRVWGYDRSAPAVAALRAGRPHLYEPGLQEILQAQIGSHLVVETTLPERFTGVVILCVSTPVGDDQQTPNLANLRTAAESVAAHLGEGALVIVRSTVPVGTCRSLVLPLLRARGRDVHLACCPERTIQGRAIQELRQLPQVVGALDAASRERAVRFWQRVTPRVVPVSSLEAAEMVKLINNSHTDLLYSYGNEVALMAHHFALDPLELIRAANLDYPRPDVARPGFVAGPCLSKDPYLLMSSFRQNGYRPGLVGAARALNERLPQAVVEHFIAGLRALGGLDGAKVLVCGFAYKGWPVTDDLRGTPTAAIMDGLKRHPLQVFGHDFIVPAEAVAAYGARPVADIRDGVAGAHGVLFVNEHPGYRQLPIAELAGGMRQPGLLYDCWRIFDERRGELPSQIRYAGIGYG